MSQLTDTTRTYLHTILELEDEGSVPLRARIAERLNRSGPTVSQTVTRMERAGLLRVADDRHLELTETGRLAATRVMRKHRLAECLLVDVIGLAREQAHAEARRWRHVMSEAVERRVLELLRHPTRSPYGAPIPGLEELGRPDTADPFPDENTVGPSDSEPGPNGASVVVRRIAEPIRTDLRLMHALRHAGARPGTTVTVLSSPRGVTVGNGGEAAELTVRTAAHVFVAEH
ncbi:dihydrofolate reductase [Streptomyces populi]|uniref:Dihydrofolate reductase n=1 Tax=Streptomyces populi TaxID=2058924 RepID=A0A2I0SP63_9ACTN|nr:metal-dependent transcriptional regulator [Streptomyces populi]PKT71721.1 dihydrofolate reductase [Streptomyces populi]